MAAETRELMDNISAVLGRGDAPFDRVVQCTVAIADMEEWPALNVICRTYFKTYFPARIAYATTELEV